VITARHQDFVVPSITGERRSAMTGYFDLTCNDAGHYSFNLRAGNHEVILTSQVYRSKTAALAGIEAVRTSSALVGRFERRFAKDDSPYFVLLATNGQIVGRSELYKSAAAMETGIRSVIANGASTFVKGLE
jgi:uncharacterized protein YegP (UPF0339 family)